MSDSSDSSGNENEKQDLQESEDINDILLFNDNSNEHFLGLMRQYSHIYKKDHADHDDSTAVKNAWSEISAQLHEDVSLCIARWESLKRAYRREVKIRKEAERSGSAASARRKVFAFYDTIKDMLASSECKRREASNFSIGSSSKSCLASNMRPYTTKTFARKDHSRALLMTALNSHEERANRIERMAKNVMKAAHTTVVKDPNTAFKTLVLTELNRLSPVSAAEKRRKLMQLCAEVDQLSDTENE